METFDFFRDLMWAVTEGGTICTHYIAAVSRAVQQPPTNLAPNARTLTKAFSLSTLAVRKANLTDFRLGHFIQRFGLERSWNILVTYDPWVYRIL